MLAAASRAVREPLVQFFAVALLLFSADRIIHGPQTPVAGDSIVISQGRVQQIAESYRLLSGRMPSRAELQTLVDDFIAEEIDYREAVALGLDADDTIVRRRMRQKLEFLAEDADASEHPTDIQLTAWLREHRADYRLPERIAFKQVLVSADTHGARTEADAVAILDKLNAHSKADSSVAGSWPSSGAGDRGSSIARSATPADPEALGDASMLPAALPLTTKDGVVTLFGENFADGVFAHASASVWIGPIASPLGAHLILITARESSHDPGLDEVRDALTSDWIEARRQAKRRDFQTRLRQRYAVRVDWPEPY